MISTAVDGGAAGYGCFVIYPSKAYQNGACAPFGPFSISRLPRAALIAFSSAPHLSACDRYIRSHAPRSTIQILPAHVMVNTVFDRLEARRTIHRVCGHSEFSSGALLFLECDYVDASRIWLHEVVIVDSSVTRCVDGHMLFRIGLMFLSVAVNRNDGHYHRAQKRSTEFSCCLDASTANPFSLCRHIGFSLQRRQQHFVMESASWPRIR